jgi:hypothetical protein
MSSQTFKDELRSFFETYPLYKKWRTDFLPEYGKQLTVDVIYLWCEICKTERPFRSGSHNFWGNSPVPHPPKLKSDIYEFERTCTGCNQNFFKCWFEVKVEEMWIRKVGQVPEWSIQIPSDLKKELGEDANLYKKALILMSQSYGLGASVYLRRIVENHINPLLELLLEIRKSQGLGGEKQKEVTDALSGKDFTTKIKVAAELVPDSLIVEGENPVKLIYDQLSISIHSLSDDEAMDIAMKVRASFEYIILELKRQQQTKRQFLEGIKGLRKSPQT